MTSEMMPCPRCSGTRFTAGGKCLLCFGVGRIADRRETDRRTRPIPADGPTEAEIIAAADALTAASAGLHPDIADTKTRAEEAHSAFRALLSAHFAEVAEVLRPFEKAADKTGVVPDDWTSQRIAEKHLRAAADLLRRVKGG